MASPKVPRYNIEQIVKLHRKFTCDVLPGFHGFNYSGTAFEQLVKDINKVIPSADYLTLYNSMLHLAGENLLNTDELAWRLAGNTHNLRNGVIVPPWTRQLFPEWAPIQVMAVMKDYKRVTVTTDEGKSQIVKPGANVTLFVMGGLAAGRTIHRFWSESYCYMIRGDLGFDKFNRELYHDPRPDKPALIMRDITELTRMRFLGLLTPEVCKNGPNYELIGCSPSLKTYNRKLMKARQRVGFECMKKYDLAIRPCYLCEMGYDKCKAACHPRTFYAKTCPNCKKKSFFDPTVKDERCVKCSRKPQRKESNG